MHPNLSFRCVNWISCINLVALILFAALIYDVATTPNYFANTNRGCIKYTVSVFVFLLLVYHYFFVKNTGESSRERLLGFIYIGAVLYLSSEFC